jgi:hypothetical protein
LERFLGLSVRPADAFHLRNVRNSQERGVTAEVLAPHVGYGKRSLERWANEGLIECGRTDTGRPRMTIGAVEAFRRTYATSNEVEFALGVNRVRLYQLVAKGEIVPVSRTGDSRSLVLFKRADVEALAS